MFFEVKEFYFVLDYHSWNFIIAFFNTMNSTLHIVVCWVFASLMMVPISK